MSFYPVEGGGKGYYIISPPPSNDLVSIPPALKIETLVLYREHIVGGRLKDRERKGDRERKKDKGRGERQNVVKVKSIN